jgi:hypothetical protein
MAQLAAAADHMAISGIAGARRADSKIDGTGTATWLHRKQVCFSAEFVNETRNSATNACSLCGSECPAHDRFSRRRSSDNIG